MPFDLNRTIEQAQREAFAAQTAHDLEATTALYWTFIDIALRELTGRGAPRIVSGGRSPAKVRELLRRYQAGDPGVAFRPARQSWHLVGRAIDLDPEQGNLENFKFIWNLLPGTRDGVTFGDINHVDVPGPVRPNPAY